MESLKALLFGRPKFQMTGVISDGHFILLHGGNGLRSVQEIVIKTEGTAYLTLWVDGERCTPQWDFNAEP